MNIDTINAINRTLAVLEREPIRRIDGRHKDGYVQPYTLEILTAVGLAETFDRDGFAFVRLNLGNLRFAGHTIAEWIEAFDDMAENNEWWDIQVRAGVSENRSRELADMAQAARRYMVAHPAYRSVSEECVVGAERVDSTAPAVFPDMPI